MKTSTLLKVGKILSLVTLTILGLSACTSKYAASVWSDTTQKAALSERYTVTRNYEWVIHPHDSVYLLAAIDAQSPSRSRHLYQLDVAMREAVGQYFPNSVVSDSPRALTEALGKASMANKSLLFFPRLGAVEDKLNTREELVEGTSVRPQGEFGPDNALFQVHIYEVRTGKLLDISTVKARGKLFAGKNTLPTDLFKQGAEAFVNNLQLASSEK